MTLTVEDKDAKLINQPLSLKKTEELKKGLSAIPSSKRMLFIGADQKGLLFSKRPLTIVSPHLRTLLATTSVLRVEEPIALVQKALSVLHQTDTEKWIRTLQEKDIWKIASFAAKYQLPPLEKLTNGLLNHSVYYELNRSVGVTHAKLNLLNKACCHQIWPVSLSILASLNPDAQFGCKGKTLLIKVCSEQLLEPESVADSLLQLQPTGIKWTGPLSTQQIQKLTNLFKSIPIQLNNCKLTTEQRSSLKKVATCVDTQPPQPPQQEEEEWVVVPNEQEEWFKGIDARENGLWNSINQSLTSLKWALIGVFQSFLEGSDQAISD